jgi:hypothetical protein
MTQTVPRQSNIFQRISETMYSLEMESDDTPKLKAGKSQFMISMQQAYQNQTKITLEIWRGWLWK